MVYKKQTVYLISIFCVIFFGIAIGIFASSSVEDIPVDTISTEEFIFEEQPLIPLAEPKIVAPLLFDDIIYSKLFDIDMVKEELVKVNSAIVQLDAELAREDLPIFINEINTREFVRLTSIKERLELDLNSYIAWETEYYYATKVWLYLRHRGYSEAVSAGILGNMMVETSGGTLALKPTIYDSSRGYYGLCQWSLEYHPGIANLPFEHQLDYLVADMPGQFKTFGKCYAYNFTYEDFLSLDDPAEAAKAFAKVYERCNHRYYNLRADAAEKAYNYFANY